MRVVLPPPNVSLGVVLDTIRRTFIPVISQDEAAPRVLLQSPGGKVYSITVDDSGVVTSTLFTGSI